MGNIEGQVADIAAARLAVSVAAYALNVPLEEVEDNARGRADVAFARQVAMYLCHVGFEFSLTRVGIAFGRDRSTVAHACHAIEDRREQPSFDRLMAALEAMVRRAPMPGERGGNACQ